MLFSPSTLLCYDPAIHPDPPADAVEITRQKFEALLAARTAGLLVAANDDGHPVLRKPTAPPIGKRRAALLSSVKREAARRIEAIAPLWRQLNDSREWPGSIGDQRAAIDRRFAAIDAIRAASDALETSIQTMNPRHLETLDIADARHWPS